MIPTPLSLSQVALSGVALSRQERNILKRALSAGPWAWPAESVEREALANATGARRRPAGIGEALLVSVCAQAAQASVWVMGREDTEPAEITLHAPEVWRGASLALSTSMPMNWQPLSALAELGPRSPRRLGTFCEIEGAQQPEARISGDSFGLAFALAQASEAFDQPLPGDMVALAAVSPTGAVEAVDGLSLKLQAVGHCAPGVQRALVWAGQVAEARAAVAEHRLPLQIIGVRSVLAALDQVMTETLEVHLARCGAEADERAAWITQIMRLCHGPHHIVPDWRPVSRAAHYARTTWADLSGQELAALTYVEAVTARHGDLAPVPLSGLMGSQSWRDWLESRPLPVRLWVLAHLAQSAADHGDPDPEALLPQLQPHLGVPLGEASREHIRLRGAVGRLYAALGRYREALRAQQEVASQLYGVYALEETSYPLSQWFWLSGVLLDAAAFDRAEAFYQKVTQIGGLEAEGQAYVEVERAKALVALSRCDRALIDAMLALCDRHVHAPFLRWPLIRALAAAARRLKLKSLTDQCDAWAKSAVAEGLGTAPQQYRLLMRLDALLDEPAPDEGQVAGVMDRLSSEARPQGLDPLLLRSQGMGPLERGRHIARHLPY